MEEGMYTREVAVGYGSRVVLSGLNLTLRPGEMVALLGRNGCGKSTLLRTLTRERKPLGGEIELDGLPLNRWSRHQLASKMAVVTTGREMSGGLRAYEIVAMGRQPYTGIMARLSSEDKEIVHSAMDDTGILHKADSYFAELSDGERQKVLIARALAQQTKYIILDEPFSFLDAGARIEIMRLLQLLSIQRHAAILFSSHDVAQALRMADYIWMITADNKLLQATPSVMKECNDMDKLFNIPDIHFDPMQNDFVSI